MRFRENLGLTFDDVLLVPQRSAVRSRSDVDTSTLLAPGLQLTVPILSANMDTVTESNMAIAMAQAGGMGVIHRFLPIELQAEEIRKVKRSESFVIETPFSITTDHTVREAATKMEAGGIGGLLVVDEENRLLGIITRRDVLFADSEEAPVDSAMTPRGELAVAPPDTSLEEARRILHQKRVEKLPLVDEQDHAAGLITAQDIVKLQRHPSATKDGKGRLQVGAAVGTQAGDQERARACVEAGVDVLVVDIAHGHAEHELKMIEWLKRTFPQTPVIAGNIASPEGVRDLHASGADAVKVGVGSGSICVTRVVTGFGVPQLTAVMECAEVGQALGVPIISDGGIRTSGDITKAIAAGASAVMMGSLLAGTDESPGVPVVRHGRRYKIVRGMASLTANIDRKAVEKQLELQGDDWQSVVPEGVEAVVPYRGTVADILYQLVGGLRSGMSYAGARTIPELWENAEFIRITPAGQRESGTHDVETLG